MKRIFIAFIIAALMTTASGCFKETKPQSSDFVSSNVEVSEEISVDPDKNAVKKYPFLNSKYTVSATRIMHGIEYRYDYYFQKGTVAGLKQTVILLDPDSAQLYYDDVVENCPEAYLDGVTVIHYMGEDASCYGNTLEMLEFRLKTAEFEYTVNFNKEEFLQRYESQIAQ